VFGLGGASGGIELVEIAFLDLIIGSIEECFEAFDLQRNIYES
jgi:hypothetical protein